MGIFNWSKPKPPEGNIVTTDDEVLGYLDELFRKRIPLEVTAKNRRIYTDILFIDEKIRGLRIQGDQFNKLPNGTDVQVGFPMDRTWWSFASKFSLIQDKPHLMIPKMIKQSERRKNLRTSFTAREQVKVTVLEGLGSGNGCFGLALDISTGGISISIDKAMILANEREIQPHEGLFAKGSKISFLKINRIPGAPQLEIQGLVNRVWRDGNKYRLAIEFEGLSRQAEQVIQRFIEPRTIEFKMVRRSKRKREELEESRAIYATPGSISSPSSGSNNMNGSSGAGNLAAGLAIPVEALEDEDPNLPDEISAAASSALDHADQAESTQDNVKPLILTLGNEVEELLPFLTQPDAPYQTICATTPVGIVKILSEQTPQVMICTSEFKGRNIIEVLEKLFNMGILENRRIYVCGSNIQPKDMVRLKMMKVNDIIVTPVSDEAGFYQRIGSE